jgi:hypothetical protein
VNRQSQSLGHHTNKRNKPNERDRPDSARVFAQLAIECLPVRLLPHVPEVQPLLPLAELIE